MPYLVIGPCLVNLEAGVKPCLHCDGPDAGKTRAVEGETSVHQAAAGTAGHPLYLADGCNVGIYGVLSWRVRTSSSSSVLTMRDVGVEV